MLGAHRFMGAVFAGFLVISVACAGCGQAAAPASQETQAEAAEPAQTKPAVTVPAPLSPEPTPTTMPIEEKPTDTLAPTSSPRPKPTIAPTATPEPVEQGKSRSNPLPLGSAVVGETWSITITNVLRGAEANQAVAQANMFNDVPEPGWEYLIADITLENVSEVDEAESADFAVSLKVTGSRNVVYDAGGAVPPQSLDGELFPGGKVSGQKVVLVPSDEDQLMFILDEMWSFSAETVRYVAIDERASISPDPALREIEQSAVGAKRREPASIGDTLTTKEWQFSVTEVIRGQQAEAMVAEANMFNDPPPDGQDYVCVRVSARFLGNSDPDGTENITYGFLRMMGASNVVFERPSTVAPEPRLDTTLFAGGEAEGWAVLTVPTDETGLLLIFEPLWSFSDGETRYIAIE